MDDFSTWLGRSTSSTLTRNTKNLSPARCGASPTPSRRR